MAARSTAWCKSLAALIISQLVLLFLLEFTPIAVISGFGHCDSRIPPCRTASCDHTASSYVPDLYPESHTQRETAQPVGRPCFPLLSTEPSLSHSQRPPAPLLQVITSPAGTGRTPRVPFACRSACRTPSRSGLGPRVHPCKAGIPVRIPRAIHQPRYYGGDDPASRTRPARGTSPDSSTCGRGTCHHTVASEFRRWD